MQCSVIQRDDFTSPGRVPSIAISMSVCLYVCLSVSLPARVSRKPHVQISLKFSVYVMWSRLGSSLTIMSCTSVFWMTSCWNIMERIGQTMMYTWSRTSAVFGRCLCSYSLLTLVSNIDGELLAVTKYTTIYTTSGVRDLYLWEIRWNKTGTDGHSTCKQQTLTTNRLADRICCLHAVAVRLRRTSTFAYVRGDKSDVWPCARLFIYRTMARDCANKAKLQKPGAKSVIFDCILLSLREKSRFLRPWTYGRPHWRRTVELIRSIQSRRTVSQTSTSPQRILHDAYRAALAKMNEKIK